MAFLDRLQTLGKKFKDSKLPELAGVILGETPLGKVGRIIKGASEILGTDDDPEAVGDALASATPEQRAALLELAARETEAREETARNEADNLTARHTADMHSQSWLSQNIRPVVTMALLVFFFIYSTVASGIILWLYHAKDEIDSAVTAYLVNIGLQIVGLLTVAIGFYFGSRAVENLQLGKPRDRR